MSELEYNFPVADESNRLILMHRDAHFGGKFSFMIEYYREERKGCHPEIALEDIVHLAKIEEDGQENLSPYILSGTDAEAVARAKNAYKQLRDLYESEGSRIPKLVADLILSEEEVPEKEIEALVEEGEKSVPALINLLTSEEFLDPLFPGYGLAPELAAISLGKIGSENGIRPLFEVLGKEGFFIEEAALEALKRIGDTAKNFLIQTLLSTPITGDNEKAAMALTYFSEDPEIPSIALKKLQDSFTYPHLALYLILLCENLKSEEERAFFKELSLHKELSKELLFEMQMILTSWARRSRRKS